MEDHKLFLVILLLNDNHLSNVKTLQSIYTQNYSNICLIACNDCTDHFDCERFLYNLENKRKDNFKSVYLHENIYPMGESRTQQQIWQKVNADYVITLHSGEFFTSPNVLTECADILEHNTSYSAIISPAEIWSDDMKRRVSFIKPLGLQKQFNVENPEFPMKDCMAVYRLPVLRKLELSMTKDEAHISEKVITSLVEDGHAFYLMPNAMCRFSEASIQNSYYKIPPFMNSTLQSISEKINKLEIQKQKIEEQIDTSGKKKVDSKKKWKQQLLKLSRFPKIKTYITITLLMLICTALFVNLFVMLEQKQVWLMFFVSVFMFLSVLAAIWTILMIGCNLYYKHFPERAR